MCVTSFQIQNAGEHSGYACPGKQLFTSKHRIYALFIICCPYSRVILSDSLAIRSSVSSGDQRSTLALASSSCVSIFRSARLFASTLFRSDSIARLVASISCCSCLTSFSDLLIKLMFVVLSEIIICNVPHPLTA